MITHRLAGAALSLALLAVPCLADTPVGQDGLLLPGTHTRLKVYGKVWLNSWYYFNQDLRDTGPLVGGDTNPLRPGDSPDRQFGMTARNSQLGFRTTTPSASWGDITTVVEVDFAKDNTKSKNGTVNLRHAYLTLGRWTLGHTWSNWVDEAAAGITVDMNGPIGQACNGSSRFTQVRYTLPAGRRSTLAFSVEQNRMAWGTFPKESNPPMNPAGSPATQPTPRVTPDVRYPSLIGAYTFKDTWGHVALRALGQNHGAYAPGAAGRPNRWGGAVQLSGTLKAGEDLLSGSIYTGKGLGEYGAGFQTLQFHQSANDFQLYRNTGWQAGYTHAWTPRVRSGLVLGGVNFSNTAAMGPADISRASNAFVNTFVQLHRNVELGMEYGYEQLRTFGAGQVVRRDLSTSDRNHSNKLQVSLTAKF